MSATSGYIAFPEDFLPRTIDINEVIRSKSKYDFLTHAISSGKVGRIAIPKTGTYYANCVKVGGVEGYLLSVPGQNMLILPYAEEIEGGVVYGISFTQLGG